MACESGNSHSSRSLAMTVDSTCVVGKPFSDRSMAASKTSARESAPYLAWAAIQASTNPGTDTDRMPFVGMPFLRYQSTSVAYGAAPVPLHTSMVPACRL